MSKFRLTNNVPDVYVNQSRDFQLLLRLYDSMFSGTKLDIDSMQGLINTSKSRNSILPLLATKVGFFTNLEINDEKLRILLDGFPCLVKNKGSLLAVKQALNLYLKMEHIKANIIISYSNVETIIGGSRILDHTLNIGSDKTLKNPQILQEIFKYILPIGFSYRFYSFYSLDTAVVELQNNDDVVVLCTIVSNPYAQLRGSTVDYSQVNLVSGIHIPSIGSNPDYTDSSDPDNQKVIKTQNELLGAVGITEIVGREDMKFPLDYCLTIKGTKNFYLQTKYGQSHKYWDGTIEYSYDRFNWDEWDGVPIPCNEDYEIYLRGIGNTNICGNNVQLQQSSWQFNFTDSNNAQIYINGNIETILDWQTVADNNHPIMSSECFSGLFFGAASLVKAPRLPSIQLADSCYMFMFENCTSLVEAPSLPATQLAQACYNSMFYNCTSLVEAPSLPATQLAMFCYQSMFYNCTSLVKASSLPATQLEMGCYQNMFYGCISLIELPSLPSENLRDYCYQSMFERCSKIKLSQVQTGEYINIYRIPTSGTATQPLFSISGMFNHTGGDVTSVNLNTTYYTSNTVI